MSRPEDWVWGTLTDAQLAHAAEVAAQMQANVRRFNLPQIRGSHTPDEWYQKRVGAEGEIAFRVLTGREIPSVDAITRTWHGPDVDGFAVKTVGRPSYHLLFDDSDLVATSLVLMLNARPRFAIIGRISASAAKTMRVWAHHLPRPTWMVYQAALEPWHE